MCHVENDKKVGFGLEPLTRSGGWNELGGGRRWIGIKDAFFMHNFEMPFPTLAARGNHAYKSEMLRLGGSEPEFKGYYMTDTAGKRRWRSEKKAAKETEERPPRRSRKARRQKQESKRSGRKSIGCVSPH